MNIFVRKTWCLVTLQYLTLSNMQESVTSSVMLSSPTTLQLPSPQNTTSFYPYTSPSPSYTPRAGGVPDPFSSYISNNVYTSLTCPRPSSGNILYTAASSSEQVFRNTVL